MPGAGASGGLCELAPPAFRTLCGPALAGPQHTRAAAASPSGQRGAGLGGAEEAGGGSKHASPGRADPDMVLTPKAHCWHWEDWSCIERGREVPRA